MSEQRRLAAIVSADVAGYSRLMGRDETGTLAALKTLRQEVVDPAIASHGGRIVKTTGDSSGSQNVPHRFLYFFAARHPLTFETAPGVTPGARGCPVHVPD